MQQWWLCGSHVPVVPAAGAYCHFKHTCARMQCQNSVHLCSPSIYWSFQTVMLVSEYLLFFFLFFLKLWINIFHVKYSVLQKTKVVYWLLHLLTLWSCDKYSDMLGLFLTTRTLWSYLVTIYWISFKIIWGLFVTLWFCIWNSRCLTSSHGIGLLVITSRWIGLLMILHYFT